MTRRHLVAYVFWGDTYRPEGQSRQPSGSPLPTGTYRIVDGTIYRIVRGALTAAALVAALGCDSDSPTAPTPPPPPDPPPVTQPPPPQTRAEDCVTVTAKSWSQGGLSGRSDFVDARFVLRNSCERRVRLHGGFGPDSSATVEIYDNLTRSGTPMGTGFVDAFEVAPMADATVEQLVILDRGAITDIPGPEALVLLAAVSYVE